MKQPKNKFNAILLYLTPYLCAVLAIVVYALIVSICQNSVYDGYMTKQSTLTLLLTYAPVSVAFIIIATLVSKSIRSSYDLSIIGITKNEKKSSARASFFTLVIILVCCFISLGSASNVSYISKKQVGGSYSYYVTEMGFLGLYKTDAIISSSTQMEYDGEKFIILLSNDKKYTVDKNSNAGQIVSELFFN